MLYIYGGGGLVSKYAHRFSGNEWGENKEIYVNVTRDKLTMIIIVVTQNVSANSLIY
jgi:hypothetical protein